MSRKALSLLVAVVMLLSVVPVALPYTAASPTNTSAVASVPTSINNHEAPTLQELNPNVAKYIDMLHGTLLSSGRKDVRLIIAPQTEYGDQVLKALKALGAKIDPISKPKYDFIVATLPTDKLPALKSMRGLAYVWEDKTVKLPKPVKPERNLKAPISKITTSGAGGYDPFAWDMYAIDAPQAREEYNISGSHALIAIVDTGADVAQPYLQQTPDGRRKIIYWMDETGEGNADVSYTFNSTQVVGGTVSLSLTNVTLDWGPYATLVMRPSEYTTIPQLNITLNFGGVNVTNGTYHFGFLPERYFDINFDHNYDEIYFVLVTPDSEVYFYPVPLQLNTTDANTLHAIVNGTLNTTILKAMMTIPSGVNYTYDVNLSNAYQITPFDSTGDYILLGPGSVSNTTYVQFSEGQASVIQVANGTVYNSIVLSKVSTDTVVFGWDGGQHGTHVSGTAAGYGLPGSYFQGLEGVAPGAQLLEFKSLSSIGYGATSWIINGMIDAALSGADVISMSLGGLWNGYNDGIEDPENFYANLLTEMFGVVFSIAAGNDGPSTTTVGAPGDADLVITVGAFRDGASWSFFYGLNDVYSGPASFSSRGPRLDGMVKPDVMAPGEFVFSSLPIWSVGYYGTWASDFWDGTSMATPHVTGAVALLVDYARIHNLTYDPFMIKRALELSAEPVSGASPIDQGYGLIKIDRAIQELIKLSKEKSTYIYAGTTFGPYQNPLGEKQLPLFANILFNGWFQLDHHFPYLYRGIYLRNERPGTVPIYIYGMVYNRAGALVPVNGTYDISTSVPWLKVNTNEITAHLNKANFSLAGFRYSDFYNTTGLVYVTVDYSQLQKPGTYVGYVYIDDPSTDYIDGAVPVVVTVPINKNGAATGHLSDVEMSGQAKHYYVDVPTGTSELKVTVSVPVDKNGMPMGRVRPVITTPRGIVMASIVPNYYFVGAGSPYMTYTWTFYDPQPGTWELTAYSSVSSYARTGYELSHYNIDVQLLGVTATPSRVYRDFSEPGNYTLGVTYRNTMGDVDVSSFGYGLGNLENANAYQLQINQDQWQIVDIINATPAQKLYYFNIGITAPENKSADLDLYVFYYTSWDALMADLNSGILGQNATKIYTDQIGPTAYESLDLFMPAPGYYMAVVNGYSVPIANMSYIYYRQVLKDNGQVITDETPFTLTNGASAQVGYTVELTAPGTYLGVVGLKDVESGMALTYAPMILQVGKPQMYVALMGTPTLGKPSLMTLKLLDKATMMPIEGEATVYINGQQYIAENGEVQFYITPLQRTYTFNIDVVTPNYQDYTGTFTLNVQEPAQSRVLSPLQTAPYVAEGAGSVTTYGATDTMLNFTVDGPSGETGYVFVTLPTDTQMITVQPNSHILNYYTLEYKNAIYLIIEVKYASPVTINVEYKTSRWIVSTWNFVWYMLYWRYDQKFNDLYQKAVKLGVDNETLQEALKYKQTADNYFEQAKKYMVNPSRQQLSIMALPYVRRAYLNILKAYNLLETAVEAAQQTEG